MANTRELRNRRRSVQNTRKITRTMELVASAKMKKAQDAADASRPYAEGLAELVARLAEAGGAGDGHPLMAHRPVQKVALLIATSDRGLCGAFNANLIRHAMDRRKAHRDEGREVEVITLGKKANSTLRFLGVEVDASHSKLMDAPRFTQAQEILEPLLERFVAGEIDHVEVVYSRFESVARMHPDDTVILPAGGDAEHAASEAGADDAASTIAPDFIYEPSAQELLDALIPQTVKTAFFSTLLQTSAGEHAARRTAMKNATDAAGDMIKTLTRSYNRARQGKITQEIAEIVGAVEAMA